MNNLKLVLGGPGCGKTTRLLNIVEQELSAGVSPRHIAFVTFNKDASDKSRDRAGAQFKLDTKEDLPWFRTIHSLAYACQHMQRDEMMSKRDWLEFAGVVGEEMSGSYSADDGAPSGRTTGDMLLRIADYAANTMMPLQDAYHLLNEPVDWHRLDRFVNTLNAYKRDTGKVDFTDLLRNYAAGGEALDVRVAVIDEGQDLTAAQWAVVRRAFQHAERVYVAGDDDQAIYHWAGADVPQFLSLTETPEVLSVSHRLPERIHLFSQQLSHRISRRYEKPFRSNDARGTVEWHQHPNGLDLSSGTWFLLARNNYLLRSLEALVRGLGIPYTRRTDPVVVPADVRILYLWERLRTQKQPDMSATEYRELSKMLDRPKPQTKELQRYTLADCGIAQDWAAQHPWFEALPGLDMDKREFYLACLRRGEKLTAKPRIRIDTIHGVKGQEAQHVLLMTDMSHRTAASFRLNADSEHRVFYVGATRAQQSLHIVLPQTDVAYPI
jgi:superfamily I DNA/RNA helicase